MNSLVPQCRYCSSSGEYGQLISPCLCKGSIKYVHTRCLQNWVSSSQIINTLSLKHSQVYAFLCELCQSNIYFKISYKHYLSRDLIEYIFNTLFKHKNIFKTGVYSFLLYIFIRKLRSIIIDLIKSILLNQKLKSIYQISRFTFTLLTIFGFYTHAVNEYVKNNLFKRQYHLYFYDNNSNYNKDIQLNS